MSQTPWGNYLGNPLSLPSASIEPTTFNLFGRNVDCKLTVFHQAAIIQQSKHASMHRLHLTQQC